MANVTDIKKVKNVSTSTPVIFGKYVILPGQVAVVENKDWLCNETWKKYQYCVENGTKVRLLESHHRRETVSEDATATLTYAINAYLNSTATSIEATVSGVHYTGKVINKGANSLVFFKETVVTPIPVTSVTITQGETATLSKGASTTLTATVSGADGATPTDSTLVWETDDTTILTVAPTTGVVTAKQKAGTANVYAISVESGVHDIIAITVS